MQLHNVKQVKTWEATPVGSAVVEDAKSSLHGSIQQGVHCGVGGCVGLDVWSVWCPSSGAAPQDPHSCGVGGALGLDVRNVWCPGALATVEDLS